MFAGLYYGAMYGILHDVHPPQHARGIGLDHHLARGQPHGATGAGCGRARHRGDRIVRRRHHRHAAADLPGADLRARCAALRTGGVFRADGVRVHRRFGPSRRLAGARGNQPHPRHRHRARRHRRPDRAAAAYLRIPGLLDGIDIVIVAVGLFAVGEALHLASRRDLREAEISPVTRLVVHDARGMGAFMEAVAARHGNRVSLRRPAGRRNRNPDVSQLLPRTQAFQAATGVRQGRNRRSGRTRSGQQRRGGRGPGAAADPGAAHFRYRGDPARGVSAVWTAAGTAAVHGFELAGLGTDRQPLHRQRRCC